jgi:hypothetical protein
MESSQKVSSLHMRETNLSHVRKGSRPPQSDPSQPCRYLLICAESEALARGRLGRDKGTSSQPLRILPDLNVICVPKQGA